MPLNWCACAKPSRMAPTASRCSGAPVYPYIVSRRWSRRLGRGSPIHPKPGRDFPSLSEEQITTAYSYSLAYPKKGRPYPAKSLKSMLDEIEFPAIAEDDDDGENE